MKNFYIILFILTGTFCQAQAWNIAKKFGKSSDNKIKSYNQNLFIAGTFADTLRFDQFKIANGYNNWQYQQNANFLAKTDTLLNTFWVKAFGGNDIRDLIIDEHGNSYITGSYDNIDTFGIYTLKYTFDNNRRPSYLIKIDPFGEVEWAKNIETSVAAYPIKMAEDSNGNFFLLGVFMGELIIGNDTVISSEGERSYFLLKFDSNGNFIKVKNLIQNCECENVDFLLDKNNNIFLAGTFNDTLRSYSNLISKGAQDGFLMKINQNDSLEWIHQYGYTGNDAIGQLTTDSINIYILGMFAEKIILGNDTFYPPNINCGQSAQNIPDMFVSKILPNGDYEWSKQAGSYCYSAPSKIYSNKEGLYIYGFYYYFFRIDTLVLPQKSNPAYLSFINASGEIQWAITNSSYDNFAWLSDLTISQGNRYLVGTYGNWRDGYSAFGNDTLYKSDTINSYIVKFFPKAEITNVISMKEKSKNSFLSPNPSSGKFQLQSNMAIQNKESKICVFDIMGRCIYSSNYKILTSSNFQIDLSGNAKGIYFVEVSSAGEKFRQKVIIQ